MRLSTFFEIIRYMFISSGLDSEMIALSGCNAKNNAPPPKNGSIYLLKFFGVFGKSMGNNCCFPPAHFRIGRGDGKIEALKFNSIVIYIFSLYKIAASPPEGARFYGKFN